MTAIDAIDPELDSLAAFRVQPEIAPNMSVGTEASMAAESVREILRSAAAVLSDAADTLYGVELAATQGVTETDQPDDDRAAGRLDYARLDLMSE